MCCSGHHMWETIIYYPCYFEYSSCDKYSNDFLTKEFENLCTNVQFENQTVIF